MTKSEFLGRVTRDTLRARLGLPKGSRALDEAFRRKKLPASYFHAMEKLAIENGMPAPPREWFGFKGIPK